MWPEGGVPDSLVVWLVLAALPLLVASCTAFTKVSVVVAALRIGLGAELLLPFSALLALSVAVTSVIMAPVAYEMFDTYQRSSIAHAPAAELGYASWRPVFGPLWEFMSMHADDGELAFFADLQQLPISHPLVLVPGFLVSELSRGLYLAVLIIVPFALVELLVAQVLGLLGISPQPLGLIALPLKILLFLAAGGWTLVLGNLVRGYAP
ncbi:MAG: hypothetical protein V3V08_12545 [Nannocystaceae bacterium]